MIIWSIEYRSMRAHNMDEYVPGDDDSNFEDADYYDDDVEAAIDAFTRARTKVKFYKDGSVDILEALLTACDETRGADGELLTAEFYTAAVAPTAVLDPAPKYREHIAEQVNRLIEDISRAKGLITH